MPRTSDAVSVAEPRESGVQTVEKTLVILEIIAERGGASAREVADALGYPLPTVYRLLQTLVQRDYLTHLRSERRFELGYKLDRLGVSLHRQVGVSRAVRAEITRLHDSAGAASYLAIYRGSDVVIAYVADSPAHPRLKPLSFGFHEAAHATAFGKIMLSGMDTESVERYLDEHGLPRLTARTLYSRPELRSHLRVVAQRGVAWEREEFLDGEVCGAVPVRSGGGVVYGSVAISVPAQGLTSARQRELEHKLRDAASTVSKHYRSGVAHQEQPRQAQA